MKNKEQIINEISNSDYQAILGVRTREEFFNLAIREIVRDLAENEGISENFEYVEATDEGDIDFVDLLQDWSLGDDDIHFIFMDELDAYFEV